MESTLDTEAVLSNLKELAAERQQKIPQILEDYLLQVARTGNVVFENEWSDVKRLLKLKLDCNIEYFQTFCGDLPTDKDFSLHNARAFLNDRFEFFTRPPFTIQRLVEVLTTSRRQYRRIDKYLRAVEKNLMVVSTIGQEVEFHCEAKYVPHMSFSSPTVSKVGQADLIPLQNAALGFDVRSNRVAMRIFNPALNPMNGDESDDEDEDEDMDDDPELPFSHPALDGSEPMDGAAESNGNDSPGRKGMLRKRKLRQSPPSEQISITTITATSSAVAASTLTPVASQAEPVAMDTTTSEEDTMNGSEAKETEPPTAILRENTTPEVEPTPVPAEPVEVKAEAKEELKMETVTEPVEESKEMVVEESAEPEKSSQAEVKPEVKSEEEVKDLDQCNDLEKSTEKEEVEPKLDSDEKKPLTSGAEEISEKPSGDKKESAETEQAADSKIPSS